MDVDDCDERMKQMFKDKSLFQNHWLYPYITPIYNEPNLEASMSYAGITVTKKKDYIQIFPTNHGDLDLDKAKALSNHLKTCKHTNMEESLDYCISICEENLH